MPGSGKAHRRHSMPLLCLSGLLSPGVIEISQKVVKMLVIATERHGKAPKHLVSSLGDSIHGVMSVERGFGVRKERERERELMVERELVGKSLTDHIGCTMFPLI